MKSNREQYIERHADHAMAQMELHGIPASVTLAQAIIESADGKSKLARNENNHFGIKASSDWLKNGGEYALYTDDSPDEKFCKYASVAESYEHHSQVLLGKRYAACFDLAPDDYKGWAQGLQKAGYASASNYASVLVSVIEKHNLQRFDQQVLGQLAATDNEKRKGCSFPLKRSEFLLVTSPFGMRHDPLNPEQQQMHRGIDIKCDSEAVLATENGGKVVAVNNNASEAGGKSVTIEYRREDGSKTQATCMHLSEVCVSVGQIVSAGERIGVSGNTGSRTTGPHLHFEVALITPEGKKRDLDPASYLAEISQKCSMPLALMHDGSDLMAKYKTADDALIAQDSSLDQIGELSPDEWMKRLLSSEDSGMALGSVVDPIVEMAVAMFSSLMLLAVQIDGRDDEEQMAIATGAAGERKVDVSGLMPGVGECAIHLRDGMNPLLVAKENGVEHSVELSSAELNRLNLALADGRLAQEQKQQRVSAIFNSALAASKMSQSYEMSMAQSQSEDQGLHYK